jgi:hypothetical protein
LKYLSAILDLFNEKEYTHRGNVAILLAELYEQDTQTKFEDFSAYVERMRTDFFRINRIDRRKFAESAYNILEKTKNEHATKNNFEIAKNFVTRFLDIGYVKDQHRNERTQIIEKFRTSDPHPKLIESLDCLLQKIEQTHQVGLHGTKEYSGVDLVKRIQQAKIGFQVKTINDDISEDKIRSQTSKALEYKLDGFVWIFGRPPSKVVDTSAQAAFHHFLRINENRRMYCSFVLPEILAELFRRHGMTF